MANITITVPGLFKSTVRGLEVTRDWSVLPTETLVKVFDYGRQRLLNDTAGRFVQKRDLYKSTAEFEKARDEAVKAAWDAILTGDTNVARGLAGRTEADALRIVTVEFFAKRGRKSKDDLAAIRKDPEAYFKAWAKPIAEKNGKPSDDAALSAAFAKHLRTAAAELFAAWQAAAQIEADDAALFD